MRLVNIELGVDITFAEGVDPKEILRELTGAGHPGSIGMMSLRALLQGQLEESNGFVVINDTTDAEEAAEIQAGVDELKATAVETEVAEVAADPAVTTEQDAPSAEVGQAEEVQSTDTAPVEEVGQAEEVQPTTDAAPVEEAVQTEEVQPTTDAAPVEEAVQAESAAEVIKKAMGINATGEGGKLTPESGSGVGKSRPRRDMDAVFSSALSGEHGPLLNGLIEAGFALVNVKNTGNRFTFVAPGIDTEDRAMPRFKISVLKGGSVSVGMTSGNRATGLKGKVEVAEGVTSVPVADVIAVLKSDIFKDELEKGVAATAAKPEPKAEEASA